ncbi:MAG: hypothetical protein P8K77_03455 [Polaribacter sp.]|nr:hypothetical protein [Polaribacter sp.]
MAFAADNSIGSESVWLASLSGGAGKLNELTDAKSDADGTNNGSSIFIGQSAGAVDDGSNNQNVGIGFEALKANTTGFYNTANGNSALVSNTVGYNNLATGFRSLHANISGNSNVANGKQALYFNTEGDENTANGKEAMYRNTTGNKNVATGLNSLYSNTTGNFNVAIGHGAGRYITNGSTANTTGDYNIFLGHNAKAKADNDQNEIVIGYNAVGNGSNTVQLGNSSISNVKTSGTITAGTITYPNTAGTANQVLKTDGSGTASWATSSGSGETPGTVTGQLKYWNGSAWISIAPPASTRVLVYSVESNSPIWAISSSTFSFTAIVPVTSSTGAIWMDRNMGASQAATSKTDAAAYGDLYQWGRAADGYEKRNSATNNTLATTAVPNTESAWDGKFITSTNDWLATQDNTLWQGVTGTNNPCPSGYRLPTKTEWTTEINSWSSSNDAGAFASVLKLPSSGYRDSSSATIYTGSSFYWSSTVGVSGANNVSASLLFYGTAALMTDIPRASGFAVRCIKN